MNDLGTEGECVYIDHVRTGEGTLEEMRYKEGKECALDVERNNACTEK